MNSDPRIVGEYETLWSLYILGVLEGKYSDVELWNLAEHNVRAARPAAGHSIPSARPMSVRSALRTGA